MNSFFRGLGAFLLFFAASALIGAIAFIIVHLVNWNATGVTAWIAPFFARGMASWIGAVVAILIMERVFRSDYPKRGVAIAVFTFWSVTSLIALVGIIGVDASDLNEYVFLVGAGASSATVYRYLWKGKKLDFL